jgi:hypothetical protein
MTNLPFLLRTAPPPSILSAWPPAPQRATATASQCEGRPSLELLPPLSFPSGSTFTHPPPCAWRCAWRAIRLRVRGGVRGGPSASVCVAVCVEGAGGGSAWSRRFVVRVVHLSQPTFLELLGQAEE